jgi:hypothetical protein
MPWQVWLFLGSIVFAVAVIVSIWRDTTITRMVRREMWPIIDAYMELRDRTEGTDHDR